MVTTVDSDQAPARLLRRDAQRNRDALLAAARCAFAEHGVDASLEQIARDAELAIGTLYRHFPARVDLLVAAFAEKLQTFTEIAERALVMDDAWEGFCLYLEAMCGLQAGDRGFNDFVSMRFPTCKQTEGLHDRTCLLGAQILQRAQQQGAVRPDITVADLLCLVWANSRIIEATGEIAPRAWRRHLHLMLDAFRAGHTHPLPEPALTDEQLYQAMAHLSH